MKQLQQKSLIELGKNFLCKKCGSRIYTLISVERYGNYPVKYILECNKCLWGLEV